MLDKTTKTKIDTARDILVGKVPNPQSQVELITIAMIYKFMDDMDMQNIEMGSNRIFFTDDLEPYAWSKVLSPKLNNWERISLYAEALDRLQVAKQIPELFRKIFKGAFLPFRDGATLSLFLNEIDGFSYNNSENLGNAFEYLLSIMGSQGDAGQFRTPRHIIDFIVDVVNPSKTDTILDPACGTAGFLISAYKHIIRQAINAKKPLTPAQHQKLMENIVGYDISPDMVKLASVNLFLHQFPQPKIYEYDTLSSEERWNDKFDIILANPPFMTPKGGIQPHNKFGVKANRAEVLFVDYMMEHLNLKGKAGFVVPEGIIFQSATAYKELRKMMVEDNYLYAVVSLPSGVFNPYSGVKTSILFFDRELAKKTKDILFVKVENDGYDLGAQRREIKDNDLPEALKLLQLWQKSIGTVTIPEELTKSKKITIVSKEKLAEDGEYNLSAVRYQQAQDFSNCQYEMVKLGDILDYEQPTKYIVASQEYKDEYKTPVLTAGQSFVLGYTNETDNIYEQLPVIIFDDFTTANKYVDFPFKVKSSAMKMLQIKNNKIANLRYVYYMMQNIKFNSETHKRYWISEYSNIEIPLPPLSVQEEIVKELDQYQAIIDGAQKVVDNWKPTFEINPEWKKVKLGDCVNFISGITLAIKDNLDDNGIPILSIANISEDGRIIGHYDRVNIGKKSVNYAQKGDLLFNWRNGSRNLVGKTAYYHLDEKAIFGSFLLGIRVKQSILDSKYLWYVLNKNRIDGVYEQYMRQMVNGLFNREELKILNIYLPSLEEQKAIVAKIEEEEQYVDACKKLIEINKQKISDKIKSIWSCDTEEKGNEQS